MSVAVTEPESSATEEALSLAVIGIDASRRVGWAKAFAALRRVEAMEEEVRIARDVHKALQKAHSSLLSFVVHGGMESSSMRDEVVKLHAAAERTFRDDNSWQQGRIWAERHLAQRQGASNRKHENEVRYKAVTQLLSEAQEMGHTIPQSKTGASTRVTGWKCTCGKTNERLTESESHQAKLNHVSMVVHGQRWNMVKQRLFDAASSDEAATS